MTYYNENFLQYDSAKDTDAKKFGSDWRLLIFSTDKCLHTMSLFLDWYGDGTFKICPKIFFQFYTFHCCTEKLSIPLVYCLLPDKKQETYEFSLKKIAALVRRNSNDPTNWNGPRSMIVDFELAMMKALKSVFPQIIVHGCRFHMGKAVYAHIQACG